MVIPQSGSYITIPTLKEKIKIKRYIQNNKKEKFTIHQKRKKMINFVSLVLQTQCFFK